MRPHGSHHIGLLCQEGQCACRQAGATRIHEHQLDFRALSGSGSHAVSGAVSVPTLVTKVLMRATAPVHSGRGYFFVGHMMVTNSAAVSNVKSCVAHTRMLSQSS